MRLKDYIAQLKSNFGNFGRLEIILTQIEKDLFSDDDEFIGNLVGDHNKKFKDFMKPFFKKYEFGSAKVMKKLSKSQLDARCKELLGIAEDWVAKRTISQGTFRTKLQNHSHWLHDYDINHYRDSNLKLELPGQYDGNHEPIPD